MSTSRKLGVDAEPGLDPRTLRRRCPKPTSVLSAASKQIFFGPKNRNSCTVCSKYYFSVTFVTFVTPLTRLCMSLSAPVSVYSWICPRHRWEGKTGLPRWLMGWAWRERGVPGVRTAKPAWRLSHWWPRQAVSCGELESLPDTTHQRQRPVSAVVVWFPTGKPRQGPLCGWVC